MAEASELTPPLHRELSILIETATKAPLSILWASGARPLGRGARSGHCSQVTELEQLLARAV